MHACTAQQDLNCPPAVPRSPTVVPKVSVIMLAYNHAPFIRQAINGVMEQVADFEIELVIVDDASRDDTVSIARECQSQRPDIIRLLSAEHNVGMQRNMLRGLNAARGSYIAFCEGDDYWCDPRKLARQIAYLESHPDVSLVFHDVQVVDTSGYLVEPSYLDRAAGTTRPRAYSSNALAVSAYIPTASTVFRNMGPILRANFANVTNLDSYMFAMIGEYGHAHEIPGVMAAYRLHHGGVWSSLSARRRTLEKCWTHRAVALDIDPDRVRFVVPALRPQAAKGLQMAVSNGSGVEFQRMFLAYVATVIAPFRQRTLSAGIQALASATYPIVWVVSGLVRRLRARTTNNGTRVA